MNDNPYILCRNFDVYWNCRRGGGFQYLGQIDSTEIDLDDFVGFTDSDFETLGCLYAVSFFSKSMTDEPRPDHQGELNIRDRRDCQKEIDKPQVKFSFQKVQIIPPKISFAQPNLPKPEPVRREAKLKEQPRIEYAYRKNNPFTEGKIISETLTDRSLWS
jgi:hypothetical protein